MSVNDGLNIKCAADVLIHLEDNSNDSGSGWVVTPWAKFMKIWINNFGQVNDEAHGKFLN